MLDFLEFLIDVLNVGGFVSLTGEWVVSLLGWKAGFVVQFLVGLVVWIAGVVLFVAAAYALSGT